MESTEAPIMGDIEAQDTPLPQHLSPEQQDRLRLILDRKADSDKPHVRDTVADFVALKQQRAELAGAIQRANAILQALRLEAASTTGAIDKCIRDVTRWEVESKPQAIKPPASKPPAKRKTKKRGNR